MTEKIILGLLASELFNKSADNFDGIDWKSVFNEARLQSVGTLVFSSAVKNKLLSGDEEALWQGKTAYQLAKTGNVFLNHVRIGRMLDEAGIKCVMLKGVASASYYPDPYIRIMGDTDVLVDKNDFDKAIELFKQNGISGIEEPDQQRHHVDFKMNNQRTELHFEFPGMPKNEMREKVQGLLLDIFDKATEYQTLYGRVKIPCAFHHGLIMLLHMQGHMQNGGMGLRHLCDWAVFVNSFSEKEFALIFENKLKEIGLWRFACLISQTAEYIGLEYKAWMGKRESIAEMLLQDIISGGNFGKKDVERLKSAKYIPSVEENKREKTSVGQYIAYGVKTTKQMWPFFDKHRWLLPFGFVGYCVRTAYRLITKKSTVYDLSAGNKRYELYAKLKLFEK